MSINEIDDESLWHIVVGKERGVTDFYYAVKTTGVVCRVGCSSKLPNRENVEFFSTIEEAHRKGYRSCKKCSPDKNGTHKHRETVIEACKAIMQSSTPPQLNELARAAELSPHYFHRVFKKIVGVTPKQFSSMHQTSRLQDSLMINKTVTEAIYEAGYSSSSRVYDGVTDKLGMNPLEFRNGAAGNFIQYGCAKCSMGWVLAAVTERGICAILFSDSIDDLKKQLSERFSQARFAHAGDEFSALLEKVVTFIDEPSDDHDLPLDIQGTAFQKKVWDMLTKIPLGDTTTYGEIAALLGMPQSARAVAGAVAANPIAVAIPCHRVLRKDGKVGGYRWGEKRKRKLLEMEKKTTLSIDESDT